ncbi:MAG: elongation factor P maturation arginine rhamnosyltransferase EarP [Sideroxydans sp.]|nr:elongation factor P maturation arginine rhamnosyltransferase EarP [Sideroxydans sp.]
MFLYLNLFIMPMPRNAPSLAIDIFCRVIDNYGDIGVCWRLARLLAHEHGCAVRLWVDDLASFAKLCPELDVYAVSQMQQGVAVILMGSDSIKSIENKSTLTPLKLDVVVEAFACKLPDAYIAAMAECDEPPVWINLEYLSAEDWVAGCHKLPSPHPRLPLTKYFFFPGFTPQTGGLLIEPELLARRDVFQHDATAQEIFWRSLGLTMPAADTLKVSLFAYENAALTSLFDAWANGTQAVLCLVPEGRIVPQVQAYFAGRADYQKGSLRVQILPFVAQSDYDTLLWACDVNFVRGEDSCVRAQWAGKPFVWQIYPQHDDVHQLKLQALLDLYGVGLSEDARAVMQSLWLAWNGQAVALNWANLTVHHPELLAHAERWSQHLAQNSLSVNLLDFCAEIGTIRAFKN